MAVDQFLRNSAASFSDKTAIYFDHQEISYRTLDQETDNLAQGLLDLGLDYQGRVAIILGNNADFVRSYFAVARAGGIIVPINPLLKGEEIKYILNDAEVGYIITASALLPLINTIRAELPYLKKIISVGLAIEDNVNVVSFEELLSVEAEPVNIEIEEEDIAACLYTSGTTGKPKGALLSHGNLMFDAVASADRVGIMTEDQILCILPFFHSFAQMANVLIPIYNGCSITILPQFIPAKVLKEIALRKITVLCAVPAMYTALLQALSQAEEFDLSTLKLCISGGSALPLEISKAYQQYGITLVEGNGPTETSPISYVNPPEACKVGSVGPPLSGVEVKIVDDGDRELPFGEIGEICVQGPNVMQGYLKQLEATAEVLRDGWFHTGDLGKVDEEGYVYIVDRKKDLIIVGGQNVYPREVEECLYRHPKVLEAAVIGIKDKDREEVPKAYIVLRPGLTAEAKELVLHCRKYLANYKCPKEIAFISGLPKNSTGKVDKKQLKQAENLGL